MSLATPARGLLPRVHARCVDDAAPQQCYLLAGRLLPWFTTAALLFGSAGLAAGLLLVPTPSGQREAFRILFVHTPAAWMSLLICLLMAFWAVIGLALRVRLASMLALALAPTGALMTLIALWTGALWGKPTAGDWWAWDARMNAELLLLALYVGYLVLQGAGGDARRTQRAGAALALAGCAGAPLLYLAVQWWHGLPAGEVADAVLITGHDLRSPVALALTMLAAWAFVFAASLHRLRSIILERDGRLPWVRALPELAR